VRPSLLRRTLLVLGAIFALLIALAIAIGANTWRQGSRQVQVTPPARLAFDESAVAAALAAAVRARTLSDLVDPERNAAEFDALHAHLRSTYPRLHAALKLERVGSSLVYLWPGSDAQARPIALMAHQDVVPVAPGTESLWQVQPFEGSVSEGHVWGRGAWDDKGNLVAQMHAVELLLASGFQPRRTVYLIFGADEEVGGMRGAREIARLLAERNVRFEFVLDEGLLITQGIMPGLAAPAALIGIAEKGFASVQLRAQATAGHSSMPPAPGESAIGVLAAALARVEARQMPASIGGVARAMFDGLAPELSGFNRIALTNLWLFGPLVQRQLERTPSANAMLRTTTALTVVQGGSRDNVLPGEARATVNFRLLPGDTVAGVVDHVKAAVADHRVEVKVMEGASEPSPVAAVDAPAYRHIERATRELFPDAVVAPGLMVGGTDGRHLTAIADNVYRYSPIKSGAADLARFHGTNERISIANLADLVRFYHRLLHLAAGPTDTPTQGTKP
jgi:carboxypeptidase PM20D1